MTRSRAICRLLAQFDLTDAADRVVKGYSGGMRRRLDLAVLGRSTKKRLIETLSTRGLRLSTVADAHPRAANLA